MWMTLVLGACGGVGAGRAGAAGILVESYPNMNQFLSSALYTYITGNLPGGPGGNCGQLVATVRQGNVAVPYSSAGAVGNTSVTAEVESAADGVPTVFSGTPDTSAYVKQYLSLGNETGAQTPAPNVDVDLPAVSTSNTGGYLGYDIAIFDVGSKLSPGTGGKNTERTTFQVESSGEGVYYTVGTNTNTGGDFVNVLLLDLTGIPGIPATVDRLRLIDAAGTNPPQRGSIDLDGVLRISPDATVPTVSATWGALKASYR